MAKEEPGRLFSKVAKFVRNPLKDWSALDAHVAAPIESGYSRENLKEMIERRQRNDFVRRREFDTLRKIRQREVAITPDTLSGSSSFSASNSDKSEDRALTLKKIDEIEEQMSEQWWKGRGPNGEGPHSTSGVSPEVMAAQYARAYADTAPDATRLGGPAQVAVPVPIDGLLSSHLISETGLEEAAICFAQGDDSGAEAILRQALAPDSPHADRPEVWLALLDLYRATGDLEKFTAASTRHAQHLKRPGPEWISLRALARDVQADMAANSVPVAGLCGSPDWFSPAHLTRESLSALMAALSAAGPAWHLDWRALQAIEPAAAAPLRTLLAHWADSPVQLRFGAPEQLLAVLMAATPANDRRVDVVWWQLRMAALRTMHAADEFELAALGYCITYEVSPPPWEDPKGSYAALDPAPQAAKSVPSLLTAGREAALGSAATTTPDAVLAGDLSGESLETWRRLDADLADASGSNAPVVSCAALVRIDITAAGTLLNWATARNAHGQRVQFVDLHRMAAILFEVIGIAEHAGIAVRRT